MDDEKMRLSYDSFEQGLPYRMKTTLEPCQQDASTTSSGRQKTAHYLELIKMSWNLDDVNDILPDIIAPRKPDAQGQLRPAHMGEGGELQSPHLWPKRLAEELRRLSRLTSDKQHVAMHYLLAAVQARHEESLEGLWSVTSSDVKKAATRVTESVAYQAVGLLPEEKADTQLYAGGLAEAVAEASGETAGSGVQIGWEYEQDGKFKIPTHFR